MYPRCQNCTLRRDRHSSERPPKPVVVIDTLPAETHHGWKFIAFGPDGKLYVPQGAPCNVCLRDRNRFGLIGRMDPDGSHYEVVARGIRNSVGFAWHPVTHDSWFTDNGRDLLGDDVPDDKLNRAPRAGMDFGFPYCHGGDTPDPEFGKDHPCSAFTPPAVKLGAHVAALGMRFYDGPMFPAAYRNSIFIAEHGSWNRSKKVGYRVVHVTTDPDGSNARQEVFAEGWLQSGETEWGRPADVLPLPDGSLLISDDYAGADLSRDLFGAVGRLLGQAASNSVRFQSLAGQPSAGTRAAGPARSGAPRTTRQAAMITHCTAATTTHPSPRG